ncbi:unnamed protein product [Rotaria sordida]|nr:unnamed protein product [Rotaria sordida]
MQRDERVKSARKLSKRFGIKSTRSNSKWKRLINTDFSGHISLVQKHNIEQQLKPHVDELYGDVDVIWQDDGDSKY